MLEIKSVNTYKCQDYMKVSIVIPVYNEEIHLKRCIESVLNQTYSNLELLLIDDGSKDKSGYICDEYALKDFRIRVFHKCNEGVSKTRNFGIAKAVGEWIMFLDSDDYLINDALEVLVKQAIDHHTLISCGNFFLENTERQVFCTGLKSGVISNNFRAWYFQSICLCAGATLYHSSIVNENMYDDKLSRYEDVSCIFDLLRTYDLSYINKCVMVYSIDDRGLSAKCSNRQKDYIFHMDFKGKSFWEKMVLGTMLNEGLSLYSEYRDDLLNMYKDYIIYSKIDCKIRRFKRYKRIIYNYLSSKI